MWREAQTIFCLENVLWSLLTCFGTQSGRSKSHKKKTFVKDAASRALREIRKRSKDPACNHVRVIVQPFWKSGSFLRAIWKQIAGNTGKKNKRQQIRASSSKKRSLRFLGYFGHLCCFSRFGTLALLRVSSKRNFAPALTPVGPWDLSRLFQDVLWRYEEPPRDKFSWMFQVADVTRSSKRQPFLWLHGKQKKVNQCIIT